MLGTVPGIGTGPGRSAPPRVSIPVVMGLLLPRHVPVGSTVARRGGSRTRVGGGFAHPQRTSPGMRADRAAPSRGSEVEPGQLRDRTLGPGAGVTPALACRTVLG